MFELRRSGFALMAAVVLALALLPAPSSQATPARAQALGGMDVYYPNSLNTFMYFKDNTNIFVNPALIYRYKDFVMLSLGVGSGSGSSVARSSGGFGGGSSGMGISPFGGFLLAPGDGNFVFGMFINRDPMLFGESAALAPVVGNLISGGPGGSFNTSSQGGANMSSVAPVFPLDIFAGGHFGDATIAGNLYIAGGLSRSTGNTAIDAPDFNDYLIDDRMAKSLLVSGRLGFHYEGSVEPGVYLGFSSFSAWADAFSYDTDQGQNDPYVSHTEGLKGTMKVNGGFRMRVPMDEVTITPHIGVAYATGQTFVDENLGDEDTVMDLANNEWRSNGLNLNAGLGVTYEPEKSLKIIWTASAHMQRTSLIVDDHLTMDSDPPDDSEDTRLIGNQTTWAGPVASIAAEYRPFKHLQLRGGVRANVLFARDNMRDIAYYGQDVAFDGQVRYDQPSTPGLMASFGMSVPMGILALDATVGGLVMGSADMQFFSRLDMRVRW